jgi:purine-binding chemotaxis protein CheW
VTEPVRTPGEETPASEAIVQLCAFAVGEQEYVLDVMRIRSIVRPLKVTPVPHAPAYVEGMLELRGAVVPVVDLRRRLGAPVTEPGPKARMLIVSVGGREVALLVDRVFEVMRIPRTAIRPTPPLLAARQGANRFFLGVCDAGSPGAARLRLLLNVKALLESDAAVPTPGGGA